MSAAPTAEYSPVSSQADLPTRRQGFGHVMLAEWTKIRSVRSTAWTLLLFVVITIGLTALISLVSAANWNGPHAAERDSAIISDPVGFIFGAGIGLGQLTICVLGVLVATTEYSSGLIRASLLAVPKRFPMLAAKAAVFGLLIVVLAEIVAFGSFFAGSALLHKHVVVTLSGPGVLRATLGAGLATLGAGLYLTVLGLLAMGIGALIRHTAGGISIIIGVVLILPILTGLLPDQWFYNHLNAYLPQQAGSLIYAVHQSNTQLLSAWEGFGVLCIWAALVLGVAAYLLDRRDA